MSFPRGDANTSLARDLFAFGGRVCRQKFWLMQAVISLAAISLEACIGVISFLSGNLQTVVVGSMTVTVESIAMSWIGGIAWWMILAVWVKRWHDRGKSGWWSLLLLIPIFDVPEGGVTYGTWRAPARLLSESGFTGLAGFTGFHFAQPAPSP